MNFFKTSFSDLDIKTFFALCSSQCCWLPLGCGTWISSVRRPMPCFHTISIYTASPPTSNKGTWSPTASTWTAPETSSPTKLVRLCGANLAPTVSTLFINWYIKANGWFPAISWCRSPVTIQSRITHIMRWVPLIQKSKSKCMFWTSTVGKIYYQCYEIKEMKIVDW